MAEEYLGDGLYASFDGYMVTLRAPRMDGDHWVGLEPEIFARLLAWHRAVTRPVDKPKGAYGEWCRKPEACAAKGYCPLDPNCAD